MPEETVQRDDWESHWTDFSEASRTNPAVSYRLRLLGRHLRGLGGPGVHLLDIGSGPGYLLADLARRFPEAELRGVELSQTAIDAARTRAPRAEFLQRDLTDSVEPPADWRSWADLAICSEVLEHVDEPHLLLEHAKSLLKPGSRLIVTVPGGPRSAFDHHIGHRRHYTRTELRALLVNAGYSVDQCETGGVPFFNLYRLMVIVRGRRLVEDAKTGRATEGWTARIIGALFRALLHLNLRGTPWGWQLVAEATVP